MYCAPDKEGKGVTCFNKDSLLKIARAYNQNHSNKIKLSNRRKDDLWLDIKSKLSSECNNEWCWLDQDFIKKVKNKEMEQSFRPKMPSSWKKNKFEWLSTTDISKAMKLYEKKYPRFMFFGPVPVDCPNGILCELSNMNLGKLHDDGISQVGIIFNLDRHDQPGSHWVAMYMELDDGEIEYYDSYGTRPPPLIFKFMKDMCSMGNHQFEHVFKIEYNKKRHQYGGSECGIYSMNFILERLRGKTLHDISNKKISDRIMNEMRKYLYRP